MSAVHRVAVVQASSTPFRAEPAVDKAIQLIAEAGAKGAKLALFPEAFVGGYPKGCNFATPVGTRLPGARDAYLGYFRGAIDVPGIETSRLAQAAAEAGVFVVIGVIERGGATLYCTALFFDPKAGLVGKHRKVMPTAAERLIWGFGDGSTLTAVDSAVGRVGAVICWENYIPMLRMAMYAKGVQIYCAPTADDRDSWLPTMRHIAIEGRCFVLSACQHIRRAAYPDDYRCQLGDAPETLLMRGGSLIVSPLGEVLAGPNYEGETILTADIDLDDVVRGKYDLDVAGHYARPDIFRLEVDTAEKPAVAATR
ncbi:MAG: carbon-nitrogen hydrolase family protein [Roseiarcus sp.]